MIGAGGVEVIWRSPGNHCSKDAEAASEPVPKPSERQDRQFDNTMLTVLCSPKPFRDEATVNQVNALRSWWAIDPDIEIFVFGDSFGAAKAAAEVGAVHIPKVASSLSGAPSFNFMAAYAAEHGRFDLQIYINADILVDTSLLLAMKSMAARYPQFLLVGERLDLAADVILDVREPEWPFQLETLAKEGKARLHGPTGVDYFAYRRRVWLDLPPVFMGRAMCDQALLHYCFRKGIPVIDGTLAILAVHQYHGYQHVKGGSEEIFKGEDLAGMSKAHGLRRSLPTIADADWRITSEGQLDNSRRRGRPLRGLELRIRYSWKMHRLSLLVRALSYLGGSSAVKARQLPTELVLNAWKAKRPNRGEIA